MKKKPENNFLKSFDDHLVEQYGELGSEQREQFEQEYESFKLGIMLQELRKEKGMTQVELAEKCGTSKTYISRIENDASDIRLSTLIKIIQTGLGGHLRFNITL